MVKSLAKLFNDDLEMVKNVIKALFKMLREATEVEVPDNILSAYHPELHICMGYLDINGNGNYEAQLLGAFSTQALAEECGNELMEIGNVHHYEIECPELDEFGYK
jgi:hypothetical protein